MSGALSDFPGELAIVPHRGGWKLLIHGPYLSGEVTSPQREKLERLAGAYAQIREHLGPLLPVSEMTRLYFPGLDLAHLKHPAAPGVFCDPDADTDAMRGGGGHEEELWAAKLADCRECARLARPVRGVR